MTLTGASPLAAAALVLTGLFLLARGHQAARRRGLLSSTFWLTFREFAGYRAHSLYPLLLYVLGLAVLLAGILLAINWLIGFYAGRFGRPLP